MAFASVGFWLLLPLSRSESPNTYKAATCSAFDFVKKEIQRRTRNDKGFVAMFFFFFPFSSPDKRKEKRNDERVMRAFHVVGLEREGRGDSGP